MASNDNLFKVAEHLYSLVISNTNEKTEFLK